ncbi:MAG: pyrroloquinoline quinone-dependent dehydrogenase [Gammaproteobacteria bacterium]
MHRIAVLGLGLVLAAAPAMAANSGWRYYGGDAGGTRYSSLAQINRSNVSKLKVAWVYRGKDVSNGEHTAKDTGFEATPIVLGDTMFLCSGYDRVIALDPVTGQEKWNYNPHIYLNWPYGDGLICRGVASWPTGSAHPQRIFVATEDARLIALDAHTGKPEKDFGQDGQVALGNGVGTYSPGKYHMTSAPTVVGNVVVVGSAIDDNVKAVMPSGIVRAYDTRTGALRWKWDPVPQGPDVHTGAANAWAPMSADPKRGLVFVPTGSASPDYYGGLRPGNDRYADSVVALHAATGKVDWAFQLIHHNLWDYDTTVQPTLLTVRHDGHDIPAIVAANKTGFMFFLDRRNGHPIFPVKETSVPKSPVPGEHASPTQPYPAPGLRLAPIKPLRMSEVWGLTPADRAACRREIYGLLNDGIFTPPSQRGSLLIPGNIGGMAWGGAAVDPKSGLLYVNVNNLAAEAILIPSSKYPIEEGYYSGRGWDGGPQTGVPFGMRRRLPVASPDGTPCNPPPWGTLTAVNYNTGEVAWSVPLGSWPWPHPLPSKYGAFNMGGPIATAGGLIFEGSTMDNQFRVFDASTGKLLWSASLPFTSPATPMTYLGADGRQYVVIASGGHAKIPLPRGETLVAFALPKRR